MKKVKIFCLSVFISSFFMSSCTDSFLTIEPEDTVTDVAFYQNEEDAQAALIGAYSMMQSGALWGGSEIAAYIEWGMTHDMYEMDRSGQRIELWSLSLPPGNQAIRSVYNDAYQGISRANTVINRTSAIDNINEEAKSRIIGQAKFIRGSLYFLLVKYFGGVPLVLEEFDSTVDMDIPRESAEAIWEHVINDFTDAANDLPFSWSDDEVGRVTKTAAWSFLVKSYIHQKNWEEVINYSEEIINSNEHELLSRVRNVFDYNNENNRELIFSIQYSQESGQTSVLSYRSAPRGAPGEYVGAAAWSNYVPNNQWINDLERDEEGEIIDERYHDTVIGPGEQHQYTDYVLPDPAPTLATRTGYILTKYWQGYFSPATPINVPVIRYPEILLKYAEALNEVGRREEAIEQVNLIRERAQLDPKPAGLSKEEVLNAIFNEYRFEFMWEPVGGFGTLNRRDRYLDFLEEEFSDYETLEVDAKPWVHTDPILLPIPSDAYNTNKALEQNPEYPAFN